jgi:hypothetical protein
LVPLVYLVLPVGIVAVVPEWTGGIKQPMGAQSHLKHPIFRCSIV